jgi:putative transposase
VLGFLDEEDPMKGKRFREEQIIRILQEAEAGIAVADLCRKRLKELERENAELKKMVAEQALDIRMLKDVNSRKW